VRFKGGLKTIFRIVEKYFKKKVGHYFLFQPILAIVFRQSFRSLPAREEFLAANFQFGLIGKSYQE
jgi:hypothetical protein